MSGISYIQDLTTIDNSLNVTGNFQLGTINDIEQKIIDISNNSGGGGSIPSITYDAVTSTTSIDGSFVVIPQLTIRPEVDSQDVVQEIYSKNGIATLKLGDDNAGTLTFSNILKSENGNATFYGNNSGETKFMEYNSTDDKINILKDMDLSGVLLEQRPFNTLGNGLCLRTTLNPSNTSGGIFEVRSSGFDSRLFCGQTVTSSGKCAFYFGFNGINGEEGDSTKYNGVLGKNGDMTCTEVKVNSIPLNSFTNIFLGSEYLPKSGSTIRFGEGRRLKYDSVNNTNSVSYSHLEEFILNSTSGDYFTCKNSNFYGTYEITATVIFRNYSGDQRYNPVIGIAIDDDTNDDKTPNWGKKAHGLTPFSVQYVRMSEGKSCDLKATRIHHFTNTTEQISINTYIKNGSGNEFNNFTNDYEIGAASISFKYLGNFDSITT